MSATSSSNETTGTTAVHATEASTASTSSPSTSSPLTLEAILDTIRAVVQSEVAMQCHVATARGSFIYQYFSRVYIYSIQKKLITLLTQVVSIYTKLCCVICGGGSESQPIHQALFHPTKPSLMYIQVHVAVNISLEHGDNATTYKPQCIYLIGILSKKKIECTCIQRLHIYI